MKINYSNMPNILKNEDFKTIQIKAVFPFYRCDSDIAKIEILPGLLHNLDKKYPTEELFTNECKKLFILGCYCRKVVYGNVNCIIFELIVPDQYSLNQDIIDKQFEFFSEMIYNPLINNNKFSEFELEREITNLKKDIELSYNIVSSYNNIKLKQLVDDVGLYSSNIFNHQEQIDTVSTSNMYDFYIDKIVNNKPIVFVMGNINEEKINKLCEKYICRGKKYNVEMDVFINNYFIPRNEVIDICEKSKFRDSCISYVYKIKDMSYDDEVTLKICRDLLSSLSSRLLNKKLRDDNDLVYSSSCTVSSKYGLFIINASINKKNVNLVKEKILEVIDDLKNEEIVNTYLDKIKDRFRISLIRRLDNKNSLFQEFTFTQLKLDISEDEFYHKMLKITSSDIIKFVDRFVLDTIYFLEEGDDFE